MNGAGHDPNCERTELRLAEYAAGALDARAREDVRRHLADCAACRDELARERRLREALSGLPQVPCPDRVSEAILAETARDASDADRVVRGVRFGGRRRAAVGLVAAAAVLALLVFAPARRDDAPVPSPMTALTRTEIDAARAEARYGLALAAGIIAKTEKKTMSEVFGRRLPGAVGTTVRSLTTRLEGGQG